MKITQGEITNKLIQEETKQRQQTLTYKLHREAQTEDSDSNKRLNRENPEWNSNDKHTNRNKELGIRRSVMNKCNSIIYVLRKLNSRSTNSKLCPKPETKPYSEYNFLMSLSTLNQNYNNNSKKAVMQWLSDVMNLYLITKEHKKQIEYLNGKKNVPFKKKVSSSLVSFHSFLLLK